MRAERQSRRSLTNEIKLHKTCQWCQLLSVSPAHYGTAMQCTAASSVGSNPSRPPPLSPLKWEECRREEEEEEEESLSLSTLSLSLSLFLIDT